MPRIKQTTVYQYSELSAEAQAKARDWWRNASAGDTYFSEHVTDEFLALLKACGFDTTEKQISWSGFSSQGDGAAFAGNWSAHRCKPETVLKDWPATYQKDGETMTSEANKRWHDACAPLIELAAKFPQGYGDVSRSHRGNHIAVESFTTDEDASTVYADEHAEALAEAARDLAHAYYRALEDAYEWEQGDEQIAEAMAANEYEFLESGERA